MGIMMKAIHRLRRLRAAIAGLVLVLFAVLITAIAAPSDVQAGWPWKTTQARPASAHNGCHSNHCLIADSDSGAGHWYGMRSPDQERRVVMSLYNRFCVRCHGIDGRGV
jgi:hypothetical protein